MLLLMKHEEIEHARFRALAQIYVDKEKAQEVFDDYMKAAFPYMEAAKRRDKDEAFQTLKKWVDQGPLAVTPIPMPTMRSKLRERVSRSRSREEANAFYKKLGSVIPYERNSK